MCMVPSDVHKSIFLLVFLPISYLFSGGADRLADFVVAFKLTQSSEQKGPFPDAEVCHRHSGYPGASQTITVTCHAGATTMARYVYFYLVGERRLLSLCEVEVFHYEGTIMGKRPSH